jgi:hypothetical protein
VDTPPGEERTELLRIRVGMIKVEQVIENVERRLAELRAAQPLPWAHLPEATDEALLNPWLVRCRLNNFLPIPPL